MMIFARPSLRTLGPLLTLALLGLPAVGCSMLATTLWVIDPNDVEAEYDGLRDRRVAVVCQTSNSLAYQDYGVTQELSLRVGALLKHRVDELDLVRQADIDDWTDHNELASYAELGSAMNADVVVTLDLVDFSVYKGQTMLQGQATVDVNVIDAKTGDELYRLATITSTYPPNNGVPVDISNQRFENQFRGQFVTVLADQIARRFYDYDSRAAVKMDRFYQD